VGFNFRQIEPLELPQARNQAHGGFRLDRPQYDLPGLGFQYGKSAAIGKSALLPDVLGNHDLAFPDM
jgi:hypothetical protein